MVLPLLLPAQNSMRPKHGRSAGRAPHNGARLPLQQQLSTPTTNPSADARGRGSASRGGTKSHKPKNRSEHSPFVSLVFARTHSRTRCKLGASGSDEWRCLASACVLNASKSAIDKFPSRLTHSHTLRPRSSAKHSRGENHKLSHD